MRQTINILASYKNTPIYKIRIDVIKSIAVVINNAHLDFATIRLVNADSFSILNLAMLVI